MQQAMVKKGCIEGEFSSPPQPWTANSRRLKSLVRNGCRFAGLLYKAVCGLSHLQLLSPDTGYVHCIV